MVILIVFIGSILSVFIDPSTCEGKTDRLGIQEYAGIATQKCSIIISRQGNIMALDHSEKSRDRKFQPDKKTVIFAKFVFDYYLNSNNGKEATRFYER